MVMTKVSVMDVYKSKADAGFCWQELQATGKQAGGLPDLCSQSELDTKSKSGSQGLLSRLSSLLFSRSCKMSLLALLSALPSPIQAFEVCMPALELEAALIDWYGEQPEADGPKGTVFWVSLEGATWTLVRYKSDEIACSIDQGLGRIEDAKKKLMLLEEASAD
jgi:hypothetical protein